MNESEFKIEAPTPFERFLESRWFQMILIAASISWFVALMFAFSAADAADIKNPPAFKAAPVPVIQNYTFYFGGYGQFGLLPTDSQFSVFAGSNPVIQTSTGNIRGWPSSPAAGATVGLFNQAGSFGYGLAVDAGYDFSRGCLTDACVTARKNGWSFEQAFEVGLNISGLNGLQPVPLPAPSGIPVTTWSNMWLLARGGAFERLLNLCAFNPSGMADGEFTGATECGSKIVAAPMAGAGLRFMITPQLAVSGTWSHVWWGKAYQLDVAGSAQGLSTFTTINVPHEDVFKAKLTYFLF